MHLTSLVLRKLHAVMWPTEERVVSECLAPVERARDCAKFNPYGYSAACVLLLCR